MDSLIEEPLTGFEFENELDAQEACRLFEFDANGIPIFTIACVNDEVSMVGVGTNGDVVRMVEVSFHAGEPELAPEDYEELGN